MKAVKLNERKLRRLVREMMEELPGKSERSEEKADKLIQHFSGKTQLIDELERAKQSMENRVIELLTKPYMLEQLKAACDSMGFGHNVDDLLVQLDFPINEKIIKTLRMLM